MKNISQQAKKAAYVLASATTEQKNTALRAMADALLANEKTILTANRKDLASAKRKRLAAAMLDRLTLHHDRLIAMANGLRTLAQLPDPVGETVATWRRPNGLTVSKVRIPIGVIGMIYEARPNVTSDAAGLCLKSGNAVILRGGSEAFHSNKAIAASLQKGLKTSGLPTTCIQTLPTASRNAVLKMLQMEEAIDLIIPRGGESLIRFVVKNSRIPVLKHYKGVCHLYIDETADADMAQAICMNAKVQRPGVCNALETLLVHRTHQSTLLPRLIAALQQAGVEVRATPEIKKICKSVKIARQKDWGYEFLDLILAVKLVDSIDDAMQHIEQYGSHHTEAIVTENPAHAERFLKEVQSSMVLVNASTRFNDGGEMGLGAEIGISTSKIHAFGPMGLQDLTICHFRVRGSGQVRSSS